jgi:hypothetical protein
MHFKQRMKQYRLAYKDAYKFASQHTVVLSTYALAQQKRIAPHFAQTFLAKEKYMIFRCNS